MGSEKGSTHEIRERIKPILNKVAVQGLKSWLKTIGLPVSSVQTRISITDSIAKKIYDKQLAEEALEQGLIGFEESSDMRVYLFNLEEIPAGPISQWIPAQIKANGIPIVEQRIFAGDKAKPMSPVYARLEGGLLRVKWAEEHLKVTLNDDNSGIKEESVPKRVVLIADIGAKTAEIRLNPPENKQPHEDDGGKRTPESYYQAYIEKAGKVLGCKLVPVELRPVVKRLVDEVDPRVVRIHIDHHTNQKNTNYKAHARRGDIRDDPDWMLMYQKNGETWAWEAQSFYWLPERSAGFLARELYSHIDAEVGFIKFNLDCSDDEVTHVITQIRAREAKQ